MNKSINRIKQLLKGEGQIPSVSIFWYIDRPEIGLVNISTLYTEIERVKGLDVLCSDYDHVSSWNSVLKMYPQLKDFEYDDFPRGRVVLDISVKPYKAIIYASLRILNSFDLISKIKNECNISHLEVKLSRDSHYL